MVNVAEASAVVWASLFKSRPKSVQIEEAVGRVLAERIVADRDFPPFNRVSMDGIAIQHTSFKAGSEFFVEAVQAAGEPQKKLMNVNHCLEVMTGAMLPEGTDTVIRYEDVKIDKDVATIQIDEVSLGHNIHRQGQDARQNDVLLDSGIVLSPAEIALLASVGKNKVEVFSLPKAAVVSSGDELVQVSSTPASHQIRRSNTYALQAAMRSMEWESESFHLADQKESIVKSLREIAKNYDVIILSGGVSKGKFDYIPDALEEIGVKKLFHQVNQRPGKPFWFGVSENGKVVFALPGNPVATYMCFYKYIKPWLFKSLGVEMSSIQANLASDFSFTPALTYFLQVEVKFENGKLMAYPNQGGGSGDFANLKNVSGFLELPADRSEFKAGEVFPYIPFRSLF
ncbi:MAG: molybdopterin molybdotransferase MoeA [Chryseolinea sp.]